MLVLGGPGQTSPAEYRDQIKKLEEQRAGLESEIGRRTAGFYQRSEPVTLAAVQQLIPKNAALIEFAVYRPFDPKAPDNQKAYGAPRYVAYVIRPQGEVKWKDLGAEKEIDAQVESFRQALRDPQRTDVRPLARALDEKVMQPLRMATVDATQLLISPDGELNLIPFAALLDERGEYLIQRYALVYLTSGRDLLRMQVTRTSQSNPLVIANPLFGEPPGESLASTNHNRKREARGVRRRSVVTGSDLNEVYFSPLGSTAQEALSIQEIFPEVSILSGARATEAALKQAKAPSILHIATHGFFLQNAESSFGAVTAGGTRGISRHSRDRESVVTFRARFVRCEFASDKNRGRDPYCPRSLGPEPLGHEAGSAVGLRYRIRRGAKRRRGLWSAPGFRFGRRRISAYESLAGERLHNPDVDDELLQKSQTGTGPWGLAPPGASRDAQAKPETAPLLLGQLHSIRRMDAA